MIAYKEYFLENGLQLIVHKDASSPMVAFNLLYKVGAKNEQESRTGFAHLFEHLMFGGSVNIPSFDGPLQEVGGENNAFTSNDLTNYYMHLPKESLETAFWLESDRMLALAFNPKSLEVQRQVVIEEFKQRYLNQPYGDVYLLLRPLAYLKHPYKWATIGKDISHIEEANMEEVKAFFYKFYRPNNAILSVVGDVDPEEIFSLTQKWFGPIESGEAVKNDYLHEEVQVQERTLTVERDVPLDAIYKAYHMPERLHPDFYATDLITDILSLGNSSRLYRRLVKEKSLFNDLNAYITGDIDPGLLIIAGKLNPGVEMNLAEKAIEDELQKLVNELVPEEELQKVKNKMQAAYEFGQTTILNKAMALAISAFIDRAELVNEEIESYKKVDVQQIQQVAKELFRKENCSTLYYKAKK
tara:strand:- start:433 stop:1671 length:1239 start_codon:yes stop_codon:yes gene_type:complete